MSLRLFCNVVLALCVELGGGSILTDFDAGELDDDKPKVPDRATWGLGPEAQAGLNAAMSLVGGPVGGE